jgi:NYN domain
MDPASPHQGIIHIYIDNSNLWIQGQKTYAEKKGLDVSFDPTWRFDAGRVKDILTKKSRLGDDEINFNVKVELYGSTPPPVDTVWEAIESHDVTVNTFARSTWTGREKQVDQRIAVDSASQAADDQHGGIRSEFMLVSGDSDLLPAVEAIVKRGFPVHIWSWENCLASVYKQQKEELIQVHFLDDYLEAIGFRETNFRINRTAINPNSVVVLDPLPKADEIEKFVSSLRIPVYRYVYQKKRADASSQDLVIIPAFAEQMEHEGLVKLFQNTQAELKTCGLIVLTFFEYCQRYSKDSSKDELAISNRFAELSNPEDEWQGGNEDVDDNDKEENNDGGFTEVNYRSEQQKKGFKRDERKSRVRCRWGIYCRAERSCKYGHTKDDEEYFKTYGHKKASKYKLCPNKDCIRGRNCPYAHNLDELLCPTCDKIGVGHKIGECITR